MLFCFIINGVDVLYTLYTPHESVQLKNWQELEKVTTHDLADAIEALLAGKMPTPDQHPSMGCSIKWKE